MVPTLFGQNRLSGCTKEHSNGHSGLDPGPLFLQLEGLNVVLAIAEDTGWPGHPVPCSHYSWGEHNWINQGRFRISIIRLFDNTIDCPGGSVHPPLALDKPQNSCQMIASLCSLLRGFRNHRVNPRVYTPMLRFHENPPFEIQLKNRC